jgi:hypothetical protein
MENLQANVQEAKSLAEQREQQQQQQLLQQQLQQQQPSPVPPIIAPLTSNKAFKEKYGWSPIKRSRVEQPAGSSDTVLTLEPLPAVDLYGDTPPLMSAPTPPIGEMYPLRLDSPRKKENYYSGGTNGHGSISGRGLTRVHSLALSDFSMSDTNVLDDDGRFIDPFADESDIANKVLSSKTQYGDGKGNGTHASSPGMLRNISSNGESYSEHPAPPTPTWREDDADARYVILENCVDFKMSLFDQLV